MPPDGRGVMALPEWSLGRLCRQVRRAHDLSRAEVARLSGLSPATVKRLEDGDRPRATTFAAYLDALGNPRVLRPLGPAEHEFLRHAYDASLHARERATAFLHLSPRDIAERQRPPALARLVRRLADHPHPALIRDDLFFVHALNPAVLALGRIGPDDPRLAEWSSWNILAALLRPASPYGPTLCDDALQLALVRGFVRSALPMLFTVQTAALHARLAALSPDGFAAWWPTATTLFLTSPSEPSRRTYRIDGDMVEAHVVRLDEAEVRCTTGGQARYVLVALHPRAADSGPERPARPPGRRPAAGQNVLFAAHYDVAHDLHVNDWPEVLAALADR